MAHQADEDPSSYWDFLEAASQKMPQLGAGPIAPDSGSPQQGGDGAVAECWDAIVEGAGARVLPQVAHLLPVVLGVRQYSARLEMHRQMAGQLHPNVTVSAGARVVCCLSTEGVHFGCGSKWHLTNGFGSSNPVSCLVIGDQECRGGNGLRGIRGDNHCSQGSSLA